MLALTTAPAALSTKPIPGPVTPDVAGTVSWFNREKGFGFITPADGSPVTTDVFVHWRQIEQGRTGPHGVTFRAGDKVVFDLVPYHKNLTEARRVRLSTAQALDGVAGLGTR